MLGSGIQRKYKITHIFMLILPGCEVQLSTAISPSHTQISKSASYQSQLPVYLIWSLIRTCPSKTVRGNKVEPLAILSRYESPCQVVSGYHQRIEGKREAFKGLTLHMIIR